MRRPQGFSRTGGGGGWGWRALDGALVVDDGLGKGLRQFLFVFGGEDLRVFVGIGEEAAFDEGGGHGGGAEDSEPGAADAAVGMLEIADEVALDLVGEEDIEPVVEVAGECADAAAIGGVVGGGRSGGGEAVDLESAGVLGFGAGGVEVEADEEVGLGFAGELGAEIEVDGIVGGSGEEDLEAGSEQPALELARELEREVFFGLVSGGESGIAPSVAGVDGDGSDGGGGGGARGRASCGSRAERGEAGPYARGTGSRARQ